MAFFEYFSSCCTKKTTSKTGGLDEDPEPRTEACEYDSCPADTNLTYGSNATDPSLNWVNSYPATSMRYGLDIITPALWDNATAELAITGPNVGSNIGIQAPFSGTIGSACYATTNAGIPSIAFSGLTSEYFGLAGGNTAWNVVPVPTSSQVFAELALNLTTRLIESAGEGEAYLPADTFLNVNFAAVEEGVCEDASDYEWIFTRIYPDLFSTDAEWCGGDSLPQETTVVHSSSGCYATVSAGSCSDKTTADATVQQAVLDRIGDMFSCYSD